LQIVTVPQTDYINPARLEAIRASCTAQVKTVDDLNLTVRYGPGSGFSGFGWVETGGLDPQP